MAGVERVSVHVSRLAHCTDVFFVEFSRAGSVGNLVVPLDRSEAEAFDVRAAVVLTRPQLEQLRSCVTDSLAHDDAVRRRRGGDL